MNDQLLFLDLLDRPVAFHPVLARLAGKATAGLLLSQLFYWSKHSTHPAGWVYKSARQWEVETTLTGDEQRGARKVSVNSAALFFPRGR